MFIVCINHCDCVANCFLYGFFFSLDEILFEIFEMQKFKFDFLLNFQIMFPLKCRFRDIIGMESWALCVSLLTHPLGV